MEQLLEVPGIECKIVKRIDRFVVEVEIDGKIEKAHINNTGRLKEYMVNDRKAYCVRIKPRKTGYRIFAVKDGKDAALIDTQLQMRAFEKCLELKAIPWLDCMNFKRNQRVNGSAIDYLLFCPEPIYLEVKSAAMRIGDTAMCPDCPTQRGRRHVMELVKVCGKYTTYILFIAAVPEVKAFRPNREADPVVGGTSPSSD